MRFLPAALLLATFSPAAARQNAPTDSTVVRLPALEVTASRMPAGGTPLALAWSAVVPPESVRDTRRASSLADVLRQVPGLEVEDRGHLALGDRVTVR